LKLEAGRVGRGRARATASRELELDGVLF
jgi:hypothetical protein